MIGSEGAREHVAGLNLRTCLFQTTRVSSSEALLHKSMAQHRAIRQQSSLEHSRRQWMHHQGRTALHLAAIVWIVVVQK